MQCTVTFNIGGISRNLDIMISSQDYESGDIMKVIALSLVKELTLKLTLSSKLKEVIKDKPKKVGIGEGKVPNSSLSSLINKFPQYKFGLIDCSILFANTCKRAGHNYVGEIYKIGNKKVFILNKDMVGKFAAYTRVVQHLNNMHVIEDEFLINDLPKIMNKYKTKIKDVKEFLVDFMENNSNYIKDLSSEDYASINSYLNELAGRYNKFSNSISATANAIKDKIYYNDESNEVITVNALLNVLLKSENIDETIKEKIKKKNITDKELKSLLFKYFLKEAEYHIKSFDDGKIVIASNYKSLSQRYNIGFDTIIDTKPIEDYKGYHLYLFNDNGKDFYIGSEEFISKYTPAYKSFNSLSELKDHIDKIEGNRKLVNYNSISSDLGIQFITSTLFFNSFRVIEITRYNKSGLTVANSTLNKYTMNSFKSEIMSKYSDKVASEIIRNLNTPQLAFYFLKYSPNTYLKEGLTDLEIKEQDKKAIELMNDILKNSELEYYTVLSSNKFEKNNKILYSTRLVRIDELSINDVESSEKTMIRASMDVLLLAIKHGFGQQGIHVEIVDNPKIDAKAFVKNGIIYLNKAKATYFDALHEYVHLFLGVVKSRNPDIYNQILEDYSKTVTDDTLEYYRKKYAEHIDTELDLLEEILADSYAKYINSGVRAENLISPLKKLSAALQESTGVSSLVWESSGNEKTYDFLNRFFNFVNESIHEVGIVLPTIKTDVNAALKYIENEIKEVSNPEDTEFISKICK